jgi:hypothetical protein
MLYGKSIKTREVKIRKRIPCMLARKIAGRALVLCKEALTTALVHTYGGKLRIRMLGCGSRLKNS